MKKTSQVFILLLFIAYSFSAFAQPPVVTAGKKNIIVTVTNPSGKTKVNEPVVVALEDRIMLSATVWDKKTEVPCQLDDLDADGKMDELAFVVTLKPYEKKSFKVEFSIDSVARDRYPVGVYAQMLKKEPDKSLKSVTVAESETGDLYNSLHHHGPAFESELIAYRIYFDQKQTVDIYGKKKKGFELAESLWYPTDEQLAKGFGDDILRVGGSVSVGTLRGWNGKKAVYIAPVSKRQAHILANGPVRTIVDMSSYDWEYSDQKFTMVSRYTMYVGHRDVEVANIMFDRDVQMLPNSVVFCTGVQKMPESELYSDDKGLMGIWGTDFPVNDTIKYGKQTVGLAVCIPQEYIFKKAEDSANHLMLLHNNNDFQIKYHIVAAAEKEDFGYKNAQDFFAYIGEWKKDLMQPAVIEIEYPD